MNTFSFEFNLLLPAFLAGLLVLATHVPMGMQVLARGIVFIDLAVAQIAGLGVIAADRMGFEPQGWAVQLAAASAALLGAALFTYTEKRWPELQEALIGVVFVLAASGGALLLAGNPHGGEQLQDLLVGQILWVSPAQLWPTAALTAILLGVWLRWRETLGNFGFYALFACAVTASVQLVGVYLVFASLIVPALATRHYPPRWRLPLAYMLGGISYALGLMLSAWSDLPSGAVIVWLLAILGVFGSWAGPKSGKTLLSNQGKAA
jgi:zinc/manganese transport system permease protein